MGIQLYDESIISGPLWVLKKRPRTLDVIELKPKSCAGSALSGQRLPARPANPLALLAVGRRSLHSANAELLSRPGQSLWGNAHLLTKSLTAIGTIVILCSISPCCTLSWYPIQCWLHITDYLKEMRDMLAVITEEMKNKKC